MRRGGPGQRIQLAIPLLALLASCTRQAPQPGHVPQPRLVLLYVPCTLNRACLSPYEDGVGYTPNLARLASEGLVFEKHVTEAGQSGVAYASIFSGSQASGHGIYAHPKHIPDDLYLVTEAFRDNGYETFAWNAQAIGNASLNGQGVAPENHFDVALPRGDPAFLAILERLERDPGYKAFVLTVFTATHAPYRSHWLERFCAEYPKECASALSGVGDDLDGYLQCYARNNRALSYDNERAVERIGLTRAQRENLTNVTSMLYRSNVMKLDWRFGRVLDEIDRRGLTDESLVVFSADHGEVMGRENALFRWTHGHALAPEVLNVPLIIRAPGLGVQPGRYRQVTRSIDVFPTLAGLCGLEMPRDFSCEGVDLSAGILDPDHAERPDLLAYSHTSLLPYGAQPGVFGDLFHEYYPRQDPALIWVGVRDGERMYKLRNTGQGAFVAELFDHSVDPGEGTNLYDPDDPEQVRMLKKLEEYKATLVADYTRRLEAGDADPEIPNDERLEMLRSLGYVK